MNKQSFVTILLTVLISMTGAKAFAHDIAVANDNGKTIYYVWTNNNTELAVSYCGLWGSHYSNEYTGNVVIPKSVKYEGITYPVTSIDNQAFYECSGLTSVTILNGVTSIGEYAFEKCSGLTSVTIPNSVTSIGSSAFKGCSGLTSITIPNSVTSIGSFAFEGCSGLTSITIPNSVTSIGSSAFLGCSGLTTVNVLCSPTSIGSDIFINCNKINEAVFDCETVTSIMRGKTSLEKITIKESVNKIVDYAFSGCSGLTSVTIPNSVTSLGSYAFSGCSGLTSVTIPNSVTSIGSSAFSRCSGLTSVTIPNSVTSIGSSVFSGCSGLTSVTIPNSVTSIGSSAFSGCSGLTFVTIPSSVTSIGDNAFSGCSGLTTVNILCSPTSIGSGIFDNSNKINEAVFDCETITSIMSGKTSLGKITINGSVKNIESSAFSGCSGLTSVIIPNSVTSIGSSAFQDCSGLTSVTIPNSVTSIGSYAFWGCSGLTTVNVLCSPTSIGSGIFINCNNIKEAVFDCETITSIMSGKTSLGKITINGSVKNIESSAFSGCSGLTSVIIPNSVTSIGSSAFQDCSGLTSVHISDITVWCKISFGNLSSNPLSYAHHLYLNGEEIKDLVIPNGVTSIGENAFYGCSGLISVTIPNNVTSIGNNAFGGCDLQEVDSWIENPYNINTNTFSDNTFNVATLYVPDGTINNYEAKDGWKKFAIIEPISDDFTTNGINYHIKSDGTLEVAGVAASTTIADIPSSITKYGKIYHVTSIGDRAFYNCTNLTSVTIPNSVTSIGERTFEYCTGLTSVTIPNSVTSIGGSTFKDCLKLTSVTIGNNVTSIGEKAFYGCNGLTSVTIPNSVTSIRDEAFYSCRGLTSVTIGTNVTSIGEKAFSFCGLTSVTIPNSVTSIGEEAFNQCTSLTSVTIGNGVTSIGNSAFYYCRNLSSVTIGKSVTSIGENAFYYCYGISSVHISDIAAWCKISFGDSNSNPLNFAHHLYLNGEEVKDLVIPNGVKNIGDRVFYNCTGLTSVKIPNSVTSIGENAFDYCKYLNSVIVEQSVPLPLSRNTFYNPARVTLYVPTGSKAAYKAADNWKSFGNIVEPSKVTAKSYERVYGNANPVFAYDVEGDELEGIPEITCEASDASPVGKYDIIISKGSVKNYDVTYVKGTLTINKAPLTVTAKDYTIRQGEALPAFEASYIGFKNNETSAVLTKQPAFTTTATSASKPGKYDITVSKAEADNYEISYVNGKLTIVQVLLGDANGDGVVNVADIVEAVNAKAGHPSVSFNMYNADLDGSGTITEADIKAIMNIIMSK